MAEKFLIEMPMDTVWDFRMTRYKLGIGAVKEIGYDMKTLNGSRILIVTDRGVAKAGLVDRVKPHLEEHGIEV